MLDLITGLPAILGAIAAGLIALWGFARSKVKQGRKQVVDEMQDAYNSTTKDLHHDKANRPTERNDVLDSLHGYAERGNGGSDT